MRDPTLAPAAPTRDIDFDRKSRLEEGDRRASNARLARTILREFWVEGTPEQRREAQIAELVASGPFSVIEARDALLDQIAEDAWSDLAYPGLCRFRLEPERAPCRGLGYCPRDISCDE